MLINKKKTRKKKSKKKKKKKREYLLLVVRIARNIYVEYWNKMQDGRMFRVVCGACTDH